MTPARARQAGGTPEAAVHRGDATAAASTFVARALLDASRRDGLSAIAVPAPLAGLEALHAALLAEPATLGDRGETGAAILWDPLDGPRFSGRGAAALVTAAGPDRWVIAARASTAILSGVRTTTLASTGGNGAADAPAPPRLFGGFAFTAGAADHGAWRGFGDARLVLPRWCYQRDGERAWLTLTVDAASAARDAGHWLGELAVLLDALGRDAATPAPAPGGDAPVPAVPAVIEQIDTAVWRAEIASLRAAIADGRCAKVVAARCRTVDLATPPSPLAVLAALGRRHRDCRRYGFRVGNAWLVGASPERLVRLDGQEVRCDALAGSRAHTTAEAVETTAARLRGSDKDRREHALVVEAIAAALATRCDALTVPAEPEVRVLRDIVHLHTPLVGRLRAPAHLFELAAALHPTPAVGGVPAAAALAWIAAHEPEPRGWYAAPIGWVDGAGHGELAVALRCGLLEGRRALLWAGAGIVRDSDADAELAEIEIKQQALLAALGAR